VNNHTAGPWTVRSTGRDFVIEGPNDVSAAATQVAVVTCGNFTDATGSARLLNNANAKLIAAAPDMEAVLDELEGAFDEQTYAERSREELDAPDDREYTVTITAKQWRAINRVLNKAEGLS
jgi:siroheme synthase (precorrin-2 oxidase/ferrochelatase)